MKRTLLDYTQTILSSLGSDEVNSISDTTESLQVADIIKTTYFNIIGRTHLPNHKQLIQLDASQDITQPVIMYVPEGVGRIEWLKYFDTNILNTSATSTHDINVDITPTVGGEDPPVPGYSYVTILPPQQFIDMVNTFNPSNDNVESFTFTDSSNDFPGTFTFYYKNNKQPQFCTVINNLYVIFDGFDNTQDSTLQNSKTMALGEIIPHWSNTDTFIPNIGEDQVALLLNEAKSLAFFELKQSAHPKAEQEAKRQWSSVQRDKSIVNRPSYFDQLPNFGRRNNSNVSYFKLRGWDGPNG